MLDLPDVRSRSSEVDIISSHISLSSLTSANNLISAVLFDYKAYQTILALISLAMLSYQQLLEEFDSAKKI